MVRLDSVTVPPIAPATAIVPLVPELNINAWVLLVVPLIVPVPVKPIARPALLPVVLSNVILLVSVTGPT